MSDKMKKIYFAMTVTIIFLLTFFLIPKRNEKKLLLKCHGHSLTVRKSDSISESRLTSLTTIYLYSNGEGVLTQIGNLNLNGKNYIIDRVHTINYSANSNDDVYTMDIHSMVKRDDDDFPNTIPAPYNFLGQKPTHLYVNITKAGENLYLFKESNLPIFLCKNT